MATLDEIRLQQLLQPFNNQTGIMNSNNAIPMINNVPMINTGAVDQDLQNTDLIQQLISQNQQKLNLANTADTAPFFFPQINNQVPQINNQVPQINNQVPLNFDTSYGVANTPNVIGQQSGVDVYEYDDGTPYYIDPGTGKKIVAPDTVEAYKKQSGYYGKEPSGIAKLFEFLKKLPTPFNLARRGLESLRGANQRLRNTDFGQSRTGAEYFMKRRERKQGERARAANADVYASADRQGFTNDRGGFSTNRADRAGTSVGSGQFNSKTSRGRTGY